MKGFNVKSGVCAKCRKTLSKGEGIKCSVCERTLPEVDDVGLMIGLSPDELEPVPLPSDGLCPQCRSHWKGKNATPESPYLKMVNPKELIRLWYRVRREVDRGTHEGLVEAVKELDEYMMSTFLRRELSTFL
jgi:predicted amidophosphoribosyltransferase